MSIKTTINIKKSLFKKICSVASQFNVSISFIINYLANQTMHNSNFKTKFMCSIEYQERLVAENDSWHCLHVSFRKDVYEKCLDFKKLYKFSTSFFISSAIDRYLNKLIKELEGGEESDNYPVNYTQFYTRDGYFHQITHVWDIPEQKKLEAIKKIHT